MIEWQRVGLFRYFLEGEVLVELERTVCESATPGVELLPLAMTSCLLYLFKVTLRVQHDAERLLHGWKCGVLFGAGCSARFVVFFSPPSLSCFLDSSFFSAAWTLDVLASWNAASPSAPSFLHCFRLSSERFKSSTAHILGAEQVGLSKVLRQCLEKSR